MSARLRILDIVNTDHAALHFLLYRANWIHAHTEFANDIVCSPGPHLSRLRLVGGTVTAMDIPRGLSPRGVAGLLARLTRHMRAQQYTIVHTHNSVTGAVGRMAARLARVPLVIHTTHGFHFHEGMSALRRWPYVVAERLLARLCDVLLFQNREEFEDLRRLGLRPRHGGYFVGNGIDLARFQQRAALPENARPVILCVARLEPVKNQGMLFAALELLRTQVDAEVWLVGDGPCQAAYEADLARRGLTDRVRFLGYRYDIPELTAQADVCVLTSLKEGIPRSLVQAMAVGVPVVATDVKGTREVVVDGESGFLVPLNDARALAERLGRLLASAELRREIGSRASAWVRERFDEERITKRLVEIYRRALREQGIAAPRYSPATAEISWAEHRPA
jgi:glycosyltransferase involved in cell wall biosynthesis